MTLILDDDAEETPTAHPPAPRRQRLTQKSPSGTAQGQNGHIDEGYLIGCFLLDEGATLDRAIEKGLLASDLRERGPATVYGSLRRMREHRIPIGLDTLVQELGPKTNEIGMAQLLDWSDPIKVGTTARAQYYIDQILTERRRQQALAEARRRVERLENGEDIPEADLPAPRMRGLADFNPVSRKDSSVLLGNRYLNRGDGAVLVSTSGMGKSALCLQVAATVALGRPAFGIQPNGPLRSLIIQSEDSDGDVAEVAASIRHSMSLSAGEFNTIGERVKIVTDRVNRGRRFLGALEKLIRQFKPDLVWINPLQAFIDGDVTDSQDLGAFLREGLNSLNEPASFGYVLIHHTTKPATGKDRAQRLWHEVMYDMAGGAEIINWARAVLSLRATETEGNFNLVLAKRGRRAGVVKEVAQGAAVRLEPVTTVPLRHSQGRIDLSTGENIPLIFWEPREPDTEAEGKPRAGRKEAHQFSDHRGVLPKPGEAGKPYGQIKQAIVANGVNPGSASGTISRWVEQGFLEKIIPERGTTIYRATI